MPVNEHPKHIFAQGKFPIICSLGGGSKEQKRRELFPWYRRLLAWAWARLRRRRSYQVGPGLWRSERIVNLQPEIYDYELPGEPDNAYKEDEL